MTPDFGIAQSTSCLDPSGTKLQTTASLLPPAATMACAQIGPRNSDFDAKLWQVSIHLDSGWWEQLVKKCFVAMTSLLQRPYNMRYHGSPSKLLHTFASSLGPAGHSCHILTPIPAKRSTPKMTEMTVQIFWPRVRYLHAEQEQQQKILSRTDFSRVLYSCKQPSAKLFLWKVRFKTINIALLFLKIASRCLKIEWNTRLQSHDC